MGEGQEPGPSPQAKRARIVPTPVSNADTSLQCLAAAVPPAPELPPATGAPLAKPTLTADRTASAATGAKAPLAPLKPAAATAASSFIADAREAVRFRALAAPTAEGLTSEISSGGAPVTVEFLHQHFGDSEQIRGYKELVITIWFHVRTYHAWIDVRYAVRRPGADKLSSIFEGAFPEGYCRSQEEFVSAVAATLATMPDLMSLGECVGTVPVPAASYGVRTAPPPAQPPVAAAAAMSTVASASGAEPMAVDGAEGGAGSAAAPRAAAEAEPPAPAQHEAVGAGAGAGGSSQVLVSVRRFQLSSAPAEVKALHARLEPLLLFTIDGANFIDGDDPQWELLLPVVRAEDGGCLVLGLTTLFNFWAYPASCRIRVSQVLVLSPWQGLGLGKALLRLSYDLAKARGCNDLTVEDPTPNLQRVREKLEVEMMRSLPWLAAQADKCLDAAARGQTAWPEWDPAAAATPPPPPTPQAKPATEASAAAAEAGTGSGSAASCDAGAARPSHDGDGDDAAKEQPPAPQQPPPHGFFSVLGVVPPEKAAVPADVLETATAAAEVRWRKQLSDAEAAATAAATAEAAADAAGGGDGAEAGPSAAGSSGGGAAAADGASGAGGAACGALVPSAAFVSAITKELKMHGGQARVVWEALLWCRPGALQRPRLRAALVELVRRRLEGQHFASVGRTAAAKRLVDIPKRPDAASGGADGAAAGQGGGKPKGADESEPDFFMYRPLGGGTGGEGGAAAGAASSAADVGAVATGRLNLTTVTAETKASRMDELMQERLQQLDSLAAVLAKQHRQHPQKQHPQQQPVMVPARQPLLPQPVPQQQGPASGGAGGGTTAAPAPPAGSKRKATDVAAMMKALEGRL